MRIPTHIQHILDRYKWTEDYKDTEQLLEELQASGWTFDYGLDNKPMNIRRLETPVPTVHESFIHFVHCKNKLRNIRTWNNAEATARALNDLRAAANECRSYARGHK